MRIDVSVIAAVHNDSATLRALCERSRAALMPRHCEIILVDDQSTDDSPGIMPALDAVAIRLPARQGQNGAILEGLRRARGEICCVLDADLEDPPEALARLVDALADGVTEVAFSSRDGRRRLSSRLFRRTMQLLFPTLPPRACLCFAMRRESAARLLAAAGPADYLVAVIGALALRARQVPVVRGVRPGRRSGYSRGRRLRHGIVMLWAAIRVRWSYGRRPETYDDASVEHG